MANEKKSLWELAADCKPLMVASAACSIVAFPLAVLSIAGPQLPKLFEVAGGTAVVWLPFLTLLTGFLVGWNARRARMARENVTADRIAELEAAVARYEDAEARQRAEEERREAQRAAEREQRLARIAREIAALHANVKMVVLALYDEGPIRDLHFHDFGGAASFLTDYTDGEELPPGNVIFSLKQETRDALDAHPEALARVRERVAAAPGLGLPLEPDGTPGMDGVLKVSDGYAASRPWGSEPAVVRDGRIVPASEGARR